MVARKVGVLVMVTLAVFAGAGGGWEIARRWRRGWTEATATLVISKLLMTVVFLLGVSAIGKADPHDGLAALSDAMAGIVVMVLVLLCPYATYKFVHWAGDSGRPEDLHRGSVAGMAVTAGAVKTAAGLAMRASTGTPSPQGPAAVPGVGGGGVASGIDPTGGRFSKEGIDGGASQKPTQFRFGEDPDADGDKGRPLIQRPGIPPLITRPSADGAAVPAAVSAAPLPQGPAVSAGSVHPSTNPATSGSGQPAPASWTVQPPEGS
jgi:hypothetical protein